MVSTLNITLLLDDFNLVTIKGVKGGFKVAKKAIEILLNNIIPKNKNSFVSLKWKKRPIS